MICAEKKDTFTFDELGLEQETCDPTLCLCVSVTQRISLHTGHFVCFPCAATQSGSTGAVNADRLTVGRDEAGEYLSRKP